jgi:hypothetical protein
MQVRLHAIFKNHVGELAFGGLFHEKCLKHYGHKEDPGVTPGTCGVFDEKAQVILMWVRAPNVGNIFHPRRLGVTKKGHKLCIAYGVRILECLRLPLSDV